MKKNYLIKFKYIKYLDLNTALDAEISWAAPAYSKLY